MLVRFGCSVAFYASLISNSGIAQTPSAPDASPSEQQRSANAPPDLGTEADEQPGQIPEPLWLLPRNVKAIVAKVPKPPAPGSPADQADLQTEIEVQNSRTPRRSAQATEDDTLDISLFLKNVEPAVDPTGQPKLYTLFDQVQREADIINGAIKTRFQRPRPFVAHADAIHPLCTTSGSSYPSGHATIAFCEAKILGAVFPEKKAVFVDAAKRIAQSRVVMGVHYATDIEEGERDGLAIARALLTKPSFRTRLAKVKAEIGSRAGERKVRVSRNQGILRVGQAAKAKSIGPADGRRTSGVPQSRCWRSIGSRTRVLAGSIW